MSIYPSLLSAVPWDRETVADGKALQTETLQPITDNISAVHAYLRNLQIDNVPEIKAKAVLGYAAYEYLSAWMPGGTKPLISDIQTSAQLGYEAFVKVKNYNLTGIQASAKYGAAAWNQLEPYTAHLLTMDSNARSGASAWQALKDYPLEGVQQSAANGASTSATLDDTRRSNWTWLVDNYDGIRASAISSYSAYKILFGKDDATENRYSHWNRLRTKLDASATHYNNAFSAIEKSRTIWDSFPNINSSGNTLWTPLYNWTNASAQKMNSIMDDVYSSATTWNSAVSVMYTDTPTVTIPNIGKRNVDVWNWMASYDKSDYIKYLGDADLSTKQQNWNAAYDYFAEECTRQVQRNVDLVSYENYNMTNFVAQVVLDESLPKNFPRIWSFVPTNRVGGSDPTMQAFYEITDIEIDWYHDGVWKTVKYENKWYGHPSQKGWLQISVIVPDFFAMEAGDSFIVWVHGIKNPTDMGYLNLGVSHYDTDETETVTKLDLLNSLYTHLDGPISGYYQYDNSANIDVWNSIKTEWDVSQYTLANTNKWNTMYSEMSGGDSPCSAEKWASAQKVKEQNITYWNTVGTSSTKMVGVGNDTFNKVWSGVYATDKPGVLWLSRGITIEEFYPSSPQRPAYQGTFSGGFTNEEWYDFAYAYGTSAIDVYETVSENSGSKLKAKWEYAALNGPTKTQLDDMDQFIKDKKTDILSAVADSADDYSNAYDFIYGDNDSYTKTRAAMIDARWKATNWDTLAKNSATYTITHNTTTQQSEGYWVYELLGNFTTARNKTIHDNHLAGTLNYADAGKSGASAKVSFDPNATKSITSACWWDIYAIDHAPNSNMVYGMGVESILSIIG